MENEIKAIHHPNTDIDQQIYTVGKAGITLIKRIEKNGEMSRVGWFQVIGSGKLIAEIKESVCDIFYK